MNRKHPKVFISHASEDKSRFVTDFATRLRENGIDAWVDQWEIQVGDSLVEKIFEGIKEADAFIIVLSNKSIEKEWVKEELNSAIIKRIEENTKLLPIVIDKNIKVPEALKTTVWEIIEDLNNYDSSLHKILSSIFGVYNKPPIGDKPPFAIEKVDIQGLSDIDSLVFKSIGDYTFQNDNRLISEKNLIDIASHLKITHEELSEIIDILENEYFLETTRILGKMFPIIQLNDLGVIRYAEYFILKFPEIYTNLISLIINGELTCSKNYAKKLQCQTLLIESLIKDFESSRYLKVRNIVKGLCIYDISASGKRYFRQQLEDN